MKKSLKIQDLITIGVYAAIYFLAVCIGTFVSFLLLPGFSSIFTPAVTALVSGSVYVLLCHKVPKFGAITIVGIVMGLFFLLTGHFAVAFIPSIIFGILADVIASWGAYQSKFFTIASFTLFSYGLTGPILPLWFMKDAYVANLVSRGKDPSYIERLFTPINTGSFFVSMAATLIAGGIGGLIGYRIYKKHFQPTGVTE